MYFKLVNCNDFKPPMAMLANACLCVICINRRKDGVFSAGKDKILKHTAICYSWLKYTPFAKDSDVFAGKNHKRVATYLAEAVGRGFMAVIYC